MRINRLLLSSSVFRRCSFGKPSSRTMALSDKSMQSNWFCSTMKNPGQPSARDRTERFNITAPRVLPHKRQRRTSVAPRFSITAILLPTSSSTPPSVATSIAKHTGCPSPLTLHMQGDTTLQRAFFVDCPSVHSVDRSCVRKTLGASVGLLK